MLPLIAVSGLLAFMVYLVANSLLKRKTKEQIKQPMAVSAAVAEKPRTYLAATDENGAPVGEQDRRVVERAISQITPGADLAVPVSVPAPAPVPNQPAVMFGAPITSIFGHERVDAFYWQVISEIRGEGITPDMLSELRKPFLDAFNDPRRCGKLLADAFKGVDWDWPRWHAFAKRRGYDTVPEVHQRAKEQTLNALLFRTLKADLIGLGTSLGIDLPKSLNKAEMIKRLMTLSAENFGPWIEIVKDLAPQAELEKVHREMGKFVASRIITLAHSEWHYTKSSDPGFVQLHPYWRFICSDIGLARAPKRCRDMNQKVLPAAEAMKTFPKIPCERLDCHCRFTTQRRVDDHDF